MKSNGFVPLLNILDKFIRKPHFISCELILTPLSPFDIKCKKLKRGGGVGCMPPNTFKNFVDHAAICNYTICNIQALCNI